MVGEPGVCRNPNGSAGCKFCDGVECGDYFIPVYLLIQWLIGIPAFFRMAASAGLMTFWRFGWAVRIHFPVLQRQGSDFSSVVAAA